MLVSGMGGVSYWRSSEKPVWQAAKRRLTSRRARTLWRKVSCLVRVRTSSQHSERQISDVGKCVTKKTAATAQRGSASVGAFAFTGGGNRACAVASGRPVNRRRHNVLRPEHKWQTSSAGDGGAKKRRIGRFFA